MDSCISRHGNRIVIGNAMIERIFELENNALRSKQLTDKVSNNVWKGDNEGTFILGKLFSASDFAQCMAACRIYSDPEAPDRGSQQQAQH